MLKVLIPVLLLTISGYLLSAQNLIPNPGFEDLRGKRPSMYPWQMINTVDYFVYDESKKEQELKTKIKDKNFKLRPARTGKAYIGFRYWPRYSEYIIVELLKPLEKEKQYYFEMYMSISQHSNAYLKSVGCSFYPFKAPYTQKTGIIDFPPQFEVYKHTGLIDTTEWFKVAGVFTAEGGERFMTIGNFTKYNHEKFKRRKFGFGKREAYYYVDDVALYKLDDYGFPIYSEPLPDTLMNDTTISVNDSIDQENKIESYFKNISFPPGSSELTYEAYQKLGVIVEYLNHNPSVTIWIIGHAGNSDNADETGQIKLSQKRARKIYIFLTGNKINKNRIVLKHSINSCTDQSIDPNSLLPCNSAEILFSDDTGDIRNLNSPDYQIVP